MGNVTPVCMHFKGDVDFETYLLIRYCLWTVSLGKLKFDELSSLKTKLFERLCYV